jgi:hypothetical protein
MSNGRMHGKIITTTTRHTIVQSIIDSLLCLSVKEQQMGKTMKIQMMMMMM